MPGIFEPSDLPAWMNPTRNIMETGREATPIIARNFAAAFSDAQQQKAARELLKEKATMLQNEQTRLANKALPIANALKDAKTPEESWNIVSQNPTWLADPDTAQYVAGYLKTQSDVAKAQAATTAGKIQIQAAKDIANRANALKDKQAAAIVMSKTDPEEQRKALLQFEQAQSIFDQMATERATALAEMRGDVPTTTIGPKGVTQTYRPAPASSVVFTPQKPIKLEDGQTLINTGPHRWQLGKQEFSTESLLNTAKAALAIDPENQKAIEIINMLTERAAGTLSGGANGPLKVGRFLVTPK